MALVYRLTRRDKHAARGETTKTYDKVGSLKNAIRCHGADVIRVEAAERPDWQPISIEEIFGLPVCPSCKQLADDIGYDWQKHTYCKDEIHAPYRKSWHSR